MRRRDYVLRTLIIDNSSAEVFSSFSSLLHTLVQFQNHPRSPPRLASYRRLSQLERAHALAQRIRLEGTVVPAPGLLPRGVPAALPQPAELLHDVLVRRPRGQPLLRRREVLLDKEAERGGSLLLRLCAVGVELAEVLQPPVAHAASLGLDVDGFRVPAVLGVAPLLRAPVPVGLEDFVRVAGVDGNVGVGSHRLIRPLLERRAVRGLGLVVQQPSRGVAHLVKQRSLQLLGAIQHLRGQLDSRAVLAQARAPRHLLVVGQPRGGEQLRVPGDVKLGGQFPVKGVVVELVVERLRDCLLVLGVVQSLSGLGRGRERGGERLAVRRRGLVPERSAEPDRLPSRGVGRLGPVRGLGGGVGENLGEGPRRRGRLEVVQAEGILRGSLGDHRPRGSVLVGFRRASLALGVGHVLNVVGAEGEPPAPSRGLPWGPTLENALGTPARDALGTPLR